MTASPCHSQTAFQVPGPVVCLSLDPDAACMSCRTIGSDGTHNSQGNLASRHHRRPSDFAAWNLVCVYVCVWLRRAAQPTSLTARLSASATLMNNWWPFQVPLVIVQLITAQNEGGLGVVSRQFVCSSVRLFVCSPVAAGRLCWELERRLGRSFVHSSVRPFIHSFMHSIHSFLRQSIHRPPQPSDEHER